MLVAVTVVMRVRLIRLRRRRCFRRLGRIGFEEGYSTRFDALLKET